MSATKFRRHSILLAATLTVHVDYEVEPASDSKQHRSEKNRAEPESPLEACHGLLPLRAESWSSSPARRVVAPPRGTPSVEFQRPEPAGSISRAILGPYGVMLVGIW